MTVAMDGFLDETFEDIKEFINLLIITKTGDEVTQDGHVVQWTDILTFEHLF